MTKSNSSDSLLTFTQMLKSVLGSRVNQQATTFIELMAVDAVMEFPYAPESGIKKLNGRVALEQHMAMLATIVEFESMSLVEAHETQNQDLVILEFSCRGTALKTGRPYHQNYISVITTSGGYIHHYKDYWNPLIALAAIGEDDLTKNNGEN